MKQFMKKLGQLFILGFPGESPPGPFLNFVAEERIGGVILFEENCTTSVRTRENIDLLRERAKESPLLVAVDQEGGRVCRLKGVPAEYRSAEEYGKEANAEHFREEYGRSAVYMESLGINLNLAPVADIMLNENNKCLKGRCFGDNPELVSEFVRAAVQTSHSSGLLSCLKHFPGLGAVTEDPHTKSARGHYDRMVWEQRERHPFAAGLEEGADLIMTTHLLLPDLDSNIVTGSNKIIDQLLRKDLGFDGPVLSDDLSMTGAESLGSAGERAIAAFRAGHDLLLFGSDYEFAIEAYDAFAQAVERGEIEKSRLSSAMDRIAGLKFNLERLVPRLQ